MENENKINVEGQENPVTIGCPSLGLPVLPGGFDGVEPMARMDYEAVVSDIFHKCNESFINAPNKREVRPGYFKIIVGDIAEAVASVVPCERSARSADPTEASHDGRARTPAAPVDHLCQSDMQRLEARKDRKIHWKTFSTKVDISDMGKTNQNGKVYEIRIQKRKEPKASTEFYCNVNGRTVMEGTFLGSAWMAKKMLASAMQALVNEKARRRRQKSRTDKLSAGILSVDRPDSETTAEDLENA